MSMNKYMSVLILFSVFVFSQNVSAQGLWGSGYYQGQMICPYNSKTSKAAVSDSDEVKEARKNISKLKGEVKLKTNDRKRAESKLEYLRKKIERFFEPEVSDFLLDTHIEGSYTCDKYKTAHAKCNPAAGASIAEDAKEFCSSGLAEPPPLLSKKWNGTDSTGAGNYCIGSSPSNAGSVSSSICNDISLRPKDGPRSRSYSSTECSKAINEYRKTRLAAGNAADKEERLQDEIERQEYAISDARERARLEREYRQRETESDCEQCAREGRDGYEKRERDWTSTLVNVGGGLAMMYYGKRAEEAANEYNAQAGWPSQNSYGHPFYAAGIAGVINGLVGPGAYGCASTTGGGGFPFGSGGGWNFGGSANGAYGPFAATGGAFGYPPNMYGTPWGGGAYMPGVGPYGQINGPQGGFQVGGQVGFPYNGYPPQVGGQFGSQFPQFQGQIGAQFPPFGGQFGNPMMNNPFGMQMSAQYQMQMLQQQQQMQQQYYQQQQQYYQMQMQQQQQAMQQQYQRQQQSMQIQMQIQQLTMQLQQLQYSGGISGGGYSPGYGFSIGIGTGGAPTPGGFPGVPNVYTGGTPGFYNQYPGYTNPGMINPGVPATGTTTIRGR